MSDLISREAAIEALDGEIEITGRTNAEAVKGYVRLVRDRLERLPSVQPERMKGKWAVREGELAFWDVCDQCGKKILHRTPFYNFCPHCGADMRGEEDGRIHSARDRLSRDDTAGDRAGVGAMPGLPMARTRTAGNGLLPEHRG